jgi:hypothetical protein
MLNIGYDHIHSFHVSFVLAQFHILVTFKVLLWSFICNSKSCLYALSIFYDFFGFKASYTREMARDLEKHLTFT